MKAKPKSSLLLRARRKWYIIPRELYLWFNIFLMLFPLYFMVISSMKTNAEFYNSAFALPKEPWETLKANMTMAFTGKVGGVQYTGFGTMLFNTVFLSVVSLVVMVAVALLAGYAMGTRQFKGKALFTIFLLTIQTVPFFGYIMPMYLFVDKLELTNKLLGVVPVFVAVSLPSTIILMQGFFSSFPKAIEEAALIDGCGEVRKLFHIVIPMAKGAIASMAIINFMGYWNEVAISTLMLTDANLRTINIGVLMTNTQTGIMNYSYVFALLVLSAVPNFIFFTIFQKSIIGGISLGGVKG
ncbi:MAG: carbohydrate ABC transporter permease [Clostridiales bacterium]|nr:carbohydrate ABC transporter permease [Clostridiales bacterium]